MMAFVDAPEEIRKGWAKILSDPVENIIKKAHRQIRDTKKSKNFPSARGVVLIFNEGNLLHNRPQDFARIAGEVIQKPNSDQTRRFPHIDGMVYFSGESVTTVDEVTGKSMPFWGPFQVAGDGAEEMKRFQNELKEGWFQYVARKTGRTVVSHRRDMKWP
jgi:hypothetical protein